MKDLGLGIVQKNFFFFIAVIARRVMCKTLRNSETFTMRRHLFLRDRFMELSDWYTILNASVQGLCRIIIFSLQVLRSLLCAKMCEILAKFDTFARVDTHFSKMSAWIFKLSIPNERPWSRDCAEEFFCIAVIARRVMRETLRNSETFTCVDTHLSETASWNYEIDIPYERPQSRDCAE